MGSITEITRKFIDEHASVKYCLKRGLINYSALARHISKDQGLNASNEAILIAARRYKRSAKIAPHEKDILELFKNSNIEIKNNIVVFVLDKNTIPDSLIELEREIKKKNGLFFSIEGTKTVTVIVQKENSETVKARLRHNIKTVQRNLSLVTIASTETREIPGVVAFIAGLCFEHGVNIIEFMSCDDDTLVVVRSEDVSKMMRFLSF